MLLAFCRLWIQDRTLSFFLLLAADGINIVYPLINVPEGQRPIVITRPLVFRSVVYLRTSLTRR